MLKSNLRQKYGAYAALFVVYIVWSSTLAAMHFGIQSIPPWWLATFRYWLACIALLSICWLRGEKIAPGSLKRELIIALSIYIGGNTFVSWIIQYLPTGLAGMLAATNPFWMIALAAILPPKEAINPKSLIGIVLGFIGILVMLSPQWSAHHISTPMFWPAVWVQLLLVIFFASGSIYARKHPSKNSLLMSVAIQNVFAALIMTPISALLSPLSAIHPTATSLFGLGFLVLFGTMFATPCYFLALRDLPIQVSSTFAYVTPVLTLVVGALLLNEPLTLPLILGSAIVIAGVIWVQSVSKNASPLGKEEKTLILLPQKTHQKVAHRP